MYLYILHLDDMNFETFIKFRNIVQKTHLSFQWMMTRMHFGYCVMNEPPKPQSQSLYSVCNSWTKYLGNSSSFAILVWVSIFFFFFIFHYYFSLFATKQNNPVTVCFTWYDLWLMLYRNIRNVESDKSVHVCRKWCGNQYKIQKKERLRPNVVWSACTENQLHNLVAMFPFH